MSSDEVARVLRSYSVRSLHQSKLAVEALLSHASKVQEKKAQTELLPGKEQNVWLMVTVKQMHPEKKVKPHKM